MSDITNGLSAGLSAGLSSADSLEGFPGVHIAVDVAVMTVGPADENGDRPLLTLLYRRPEGFAAGSWSLPGRFVRFEERLREAAAKCLVEKAGIRGITPRQLTVLDKPKRDPRGWTMSVGHIAPVPFEWAARAVAESPNTRELAVVTERQIRFPNSQAELPFEQQKIVDYAVDYLRERYYRSPDPKGFLGERFTLAELFAVHSAVLGKDFYSRDSFRRTFEPWLEETGETTRGGIGKPAMLYTRRDKPQRTPRRINKPSSSQIATDF